MIDLKAGNLYTFKGVNGCNAHITNGSDRVQEIGTLTSGTDVVFLGYDDLQPDKTDFAPVLIKILTQTGTVGFVAVWNGEMVPAKKE